VLGVGVFLELGRNEESGLWSPLVRLTGQRAEASMMGAMAPADYTWLTLSADFCPIRAAIARTLWVRPCVRAGGGELSGSATLSGQAVSEHRPWVAAGLLARLQWRPVGPLLFEAQGGAAYSFAHDALAFAGDPTGKTLPVLSPAPFEPFGGVGLGLTFP
jgi:hypothetical protein